MDNWISEEARYRLQRMLWERSKSLDGYLFSKSLDRHRLWQEFLKRNGIQLVPGGDAVYYRDESSTAVCSPLEYGSLKIPRDFAEKVLTLDFIP